MQIENTTVPVATPEDLAVMKTFAGRPRAINDIATLLSAHPGLNRRYIRTQVKKLCDLAEDWERLRLWERLEKEHPPTGDT